MGKIRVFVVEDEAIVAMDIEERLANMGYEPVGRASTGRDAIELVGQVKPDLVLMDIRLQGDMDGIAAATEIRQKYSAPVVFLTAHAENDTLELAKMAQPYSYLVKPFRDPDLKSAIEIARHKYETDRKIIRLNRLLDVLGQVNQAMMRCTRREEIFQEVCHHIVGRGSVDMAWITWIAPEDQRFVPVARKLRDDSYSILTDLWSHSCPRCRLNPEQVLRAGRPFCCSDITTESCYFASPEFAVPLRLHSWGAFPLRLQGEVCGAVNIASEDADFLQEAEVKLMEEIALDVSFVLDRIEADERKRLDDEALRQSEARFSDVTFSLGDWVWETDENGVYTYSSGKGMDHFGDVIGKTPFDLMDEDESRRIRAIFSDLAAKKAPIKDLENCNINKDGDKVYLLTNGVPILDLDGKLRGYRGVDRDITEQKRQDEEKKRLEAQLQQAQKMEFVGRLAGGVAHDFNNMLGVILGHVELAIEQVSAEHAVQSDLEEIRKAANRSADLTRQLLAFARQQTVVPRVLDMNETIASMFSMLSRLIGENVTLKWQAKAGIWPVFLDPSQVDQIIANLCVNARDAIDGVGTIIIETSNVQIDEAYCVAHTGFTPGDYLSLVVSDSGQGMEREALSHIFEPFYTTKELGKGTGLGLSTVYGAVKQNGGFVNVYSEVGQGTSFSIYLPRYLGATPSNDVVRTVLPIPCGEETILVVEDEPSILKLATIVLEKQGYQVLPASTPGEALTIARNHRGEIHLLVTDVILPEMNGRALAKSVLAIHPKVKRLFMSGYTADVIAHHGVLDSGVHFLQKPFTRNSLTTSVRNTLDSDY